MITPILRKPHTDAEGTEDNAETRMRQALGKLGTAKPSKSEPLRRTSYQMKAGAGRHRFKQDDEVPVVRISLAKGGCGGEHHPRAPAEAAQARAGQGHRADVRGQDGGESTRQVLVLTEQLQATRTRLGHAELAAGEASRTSQALQEEAAGLRRALDTAEATLAQMRVELAASERARAVLEQQRDTMRPPCPEPAERDGIAVRRKVGRPLGSASRIRGQEPTSKPQPVKWWAGD